MATSQIKAKVLTETKNYNFNSSNSTTLIKDGYIPVAAFEPGVWKGLLISYAYDGRGIMEVAGYGNSTHTLTVIWLGLGG